MPCAIIAADHVLLGCTIMCPSHAPPMFYRDSLYRDDTGTFDATALFIQGTNEVLLNLSNTAEHSSQQARTRVYCYTTAC